MTVNMTILHGGGRRRDSSNDNSDNNNNEDAKSTLDEEAAIHMDRAKSTTLLLRHLMMAHLPTMLEM